MMIVNYAARIVNKLDASLTDNARVVIYDRHMFIVQATGPNYVGASVTMKKDLWDWSQIGEDLTETIHLLDTKVIDHATEGIRSLYHNTIYSSNYYCNVVNLLVFSHYLFHPSIVFAGKAGAYQGSIS